MSQSDAESENQSYEHVEAQIVPANDFRLEIVEPEPVIPIPPEEEKKACCYTYSYATDKQDTKESAEYFLLSDLE
jgi:hypothetical protein